MKVLRYNKKYQFLVNFALGILEKREIPHGELTLRFYKSDPLLQGYATFSLPWSPQARNKKPTIHFNTEKSEELNESDMKYCIAHEIGHYKDWLESDLPIGTLFQPYNAIKDEQKANKFAKGIMGYMPDWLPEEYK